MVSDSNWDVYNVGRSCDTGSSVNSDRSDQSGGEGPGKGRRKSQAGDSTDSDEKQKSLKLKSEQSNG